MWGVDRRDVAALQEALGTLGPRAEPQALLRARGHGLGTGARRSPRGHGPDLAGRGRHPVVDDAVTDKVVYFFAKDLTSLALLRDANVCYNGLKRLAGDAKLASSGCDGGSGD